jgi:AAA+ superfamily predicted ATPase
MKCNKTKKAEQVNFNVIDTFGRISDAIKGAGDLYLSYFNPNYGYIEKANKQDDMDSRFDDFDSEESRDTNAVDEEAVAHIRKMAAYLGISEELTIVFMALYATLLLHNLYADKQNISKYLSVGVSRVLYIQNCMEELEDKGLIERCRDRGFRVGYEINTSVENAIRKNLPLNTDNTGNMDIFKFCQKVAHFVKNRDFYDSETSEMFDEISKLEERYPDIPFLKEVASKLKHIDDRLLLYMVVYVYFTEGRGMLANAMLQHIYDEARDRFKQAKKLMKNAHVLQTKKYVSLEQGGHFDDARLHLSTALKKKILGDDYQLFVEDDQNQNMVMKAKDIQAKELFFDGQTQTQLQMLSNSLQDKQFKNLQKRLESRAMPKGVAVLLYGEPGTGKTESVLQLARQTGRDILQVDIAACKSKWYGESQQIVRYLFTRYREVCKECALKPILFFNEADALFSRRLDVGDSAVAQTENAIQNIILEEMEHLDGILIATTNMMRNFDDAFSRRFLFKVKFDMPTPEAKKSIWKSKLDWLTDEQAERLAAKFALSGGEIDNIVRKTIMNEVISAELPSMEQIEDWCREEKSGKESSKIGFAC